MKRKLLKTRKSRIYGVIAFSIIAALMLAVPAFAAEPTDVSSSNGNSLGQIKVPVVYDGVLYQAEEFNTIKDQLPMELFLPGDTGEILYIFGSVKDHVHFVNKEGDNSLNKETLIPGPKSIDVGYGYNWENIDRGGHCLAVQEDYTIPDLCDYSWNDRISSCYFPYDSDKPSNYFMLLGRDAYEDDYFFAVRNGLSVSSLVPYGWNDEASSIYWGYIS